MELVQLQKRKAEFDALNIQIFSVIMVPDEAKKMKNTVKPDFEILIDEKGRLVDHFGIRHKDANPIQGGDLPQCSSFLFDGKGKLIWHKLAETWRVRPAPDEILDAAKAHFSG